MIPYVTRLGIVFPLFYTTPQTAGTVHEAACQHRTATLGGASWCSVFEPVLGSHTGSLQNAPKKDHGNPLRWHRSV